MVNQGRVGDAARAPEIQSDVEAIRADVASLRAELTNLVHDLINAGKVRAGGAGQRLTGAARSRIDQLGSTWDQASDQGRQVIEDIQDRIEEHPLTSIGVAFGAGLLLGALLKR